MTISKHRATFAALWLYCILAKINGVYTHSCLSLCVSTYDTGLVIVSLKATLGFPITQGQLYSRSIL